MEQAHPKKYKVHEIELTDKDLKNKNLGLLNKIKKTENFVCDSISNSKLTSNIFYNDILE